VKLETINFYKSIKKKKSNQKNKDKFENINT
jgi:hypothetical protein